MPDFIKVKAKKSKRTFWMNIDQIAHIHIDKLPNSEGYEMVLYSSDFEDEGVIAIGEIASFEELYREVFCNNTPRSRYAKRPNIDSDSK